MLTFFPQPYRDELLYSILCRYHVLSGNLHDCDTMEQLFGEKAEHLNTNIPVNLSKLAVQTKSYGLNFDRLLKNYTLFPYTLLFAKQETVNINDTYFRDRNNLLCSRHVSMPIPELRYCPLCVEADRKRYGEAYWHRSHQIAELRYCPAHQVPLIASGIKHLSLAKKFFPLESAANTIHEMPLVRKPSTAEQRLQEDILFCLENPQRVRSTFCACKEDFTDIYLSLLSQKGLATENWSLHKEKLLFSAEQFFGKEFLESVDSYWNSGKKPWIFRICQHNSRSYGTVKHILMAEFLSGSVEKLLCYADVNRQKLIQQRPTYSKKILPETLQEYKRRWQTAANRATKNTISAITAEDQAAYLWLFRHDKVWLYANSPAPCKRGGTVCITDFKAKDERLAVLVEQVVCKLKRVSGKPQWVTRNRILQELGQEESNFNTRKNKFPHTVASIERLTESKHEWRVQKIQWAVQNILESGETLAIWRILRKAGISEKLWTEYEPIALWIIQNSEYSMHRFEEQGESVFSEQ